MNHKERQERLPVHIIQSPKLSLKVILLSEEEDKRIRAQEEMANSILHHHNRDIWVYMKHFTLTDLFCPHNRLRDWSCYLPCKTEKTKIHRDRILSPLLFLIILYCLPGEIYSLMAKLSVSPKHLYIL